LTKAAAHSVVARSAVGGMAVGDAAGTGTTQ